MKKLFILTSIIFILSVKPTYAAEHVQITVNGMVCDFCARAIEKVFSRREEVAQITVNLGEKEITVDMKDGQTLDDETIARLVTDAGYALVSIERGQGDE